MKKIIAFFQDCVGEMKKVVWPTRDDVISSTKVVIVSTILIALVLGAIDLGIYEGLKALFKIRIG